MKNKTLRYIAGLLLISSAITHVIQIFFYPPEGHTLAAVGYGILYGIIGTILIIYDKNKYVPLICAILPAIGGVLGTIRFIGMLKLQGVFNPFIIYHIIVDIIVVPDCILLYRRTNNKKSD